MLTTLLITIIILVICVVLLSVKVIFKKNGRFPNTHIEGNAALRKKGIYIGTHIKKCAGISDVDFGENRNIKKIKLSTMEFAVIDKE